MGSSRRTVSVAGEDSAKGKRRTRLAEAISARPNGAAAIRDRNLRRSTSVLVIFTVIHHHRRRIYIVDIIKVKWYSQSMLSQNQKTVSIACFAALLILAAALTHAASRAFHPPAATQSPFRVAVSVSPFAELMFSSGLVFTDGKSTARTVDELQKMFVAHGANEVYARIATSRKNTPGFGDHSFDRGLMRARLAKSLGLPFNPELGLFKAYGDVRCQPSPDFSEYPEIKVPGAWTSLTIDQMLPILRAYGASAAKLILSTGATVRVWDLGNEVDFGVAGVAPQPMPDACDDLTSGAKWYQPPDKVDPEIGKQSVLDLLKLSEVDRVAWLRAHVWPHEARMFAAVAEGIRSVAPDAKFSTHVSGVLAVRSDRSRSLLQGNEGGRLSSRRIGIFVLPVVNARSGRSSASVQKNCDAGAHHIRTSGICRRVRISIRRESGAGRAICFLE